MTFRFSTYERQAQRADSNVVTVNAKPISVNLNHGQLTPPSSGGIAQGLTVASKMFLQYASQQAEKERIERNQQEILQGMSMAAQGQAIDEIANKRSGLDKFFNNTNLIDGAKAYYSANKGNEVLQELQDQMPDMIALNPDEARQLIQNKISKVTTGDEGTDLQVRQQIMRHIPQIMKTQAKGHYDWQQEQLLKVQDQYMQSNSGMLAQQLKQMSRDPNTNPKDIGNVVQGFAAGLLPVDGQDHQMWAKNVTQGIQLAAERAGRPMQIKKADGTTETVTGDLWTLELYRQSGIIEALPAQQQTQALTAIDAAEARARKKFAEDYSAPLANLTALATQPLEGSTTREINDEIDRLNRDYMSRTGSSTPLIDSGERKGYLEKSIQAITREREKRLEKQQRIQERLEDIRIRRQERARDRADRAAERAADRADREAEKAAIEQAKIKAQHDKEAAIIQHGTQAWAVAKRGYGYTESDVQKVAAEMVDNAPDFDGKVAVMKHFDGHPIAAIADDLQRQAQKVIEDPDIPTKSPDTLLALADRFNKVKGALGDSMAEKYYGEELYNRLSKFSSDYEATGNAAVAWQANSIGSKKGFTDYHGSMQKAEEIFDENKHSFLGFEWGSTSGMDGSSEAVLKDALSRQYDKSLRLAHGDEEAAKRDTIKRVMQDPDAPVMQIGKLVAKAPQKADQRITTYLTNARIRGDKRVSIAPDELGDVINEVMERHFYGDEKNPALIDQTRNWFFKNKAAGVRVTQISQHGKPALFVQAFGKDGGPDVAFAVPADEILDHYEQSRLNKKGIFDRVKGTLGF